MKQKFLLLSFLFYAFIFSHPSKVYAQEEKTIKLIVSGDANTKEEATKNALRSAIEQAFGTFVSANTEILNDEVIKDEIATISSGNIQSYKELSCDLNNDSTYSVTLETVVSIGKLVNFTKSKGATAELAGATFAMNMKIRELNKENEALAFENLKTTLLKMHKEHFFFDYKLSLEEPYIYDEDHYGIEARVSFMPNQNFVLFWNTIIDYFDALSLTKEESNNYSILNIDKWEKSVSPRLQYENLNQTYFSNPNSYAFRNPTDNLRNTIGKIILMNQLSFCISDNLNNCWETYCLDGRTHYLGDIFYISSGNESKDIYNYYKSICYEEYYPLACAFYNPYDKYSITPINSYRLLYLGEWGFWILNLDGREHYIALDLIYPKEDLERLSEITISCQKPQFRKISQYNPLVIEIDSIIDVQDEFYLLDEEYEEYEE